MEIYIANPKPYEHNFIYRMHSLPAPYEVMIPAGQQRVIERRDMDEENALKIIDAAMVYGAVYHDEIDRQPKDKKISLLISMDGQISAECIQAAIEHNDRVGEEEFKANLANYAQAASRQLTGINGGLNTLTVSVRELDRHGFTKTMGDSSVTIHNPSEESMRPRN